MYALQWLLANSKHFYFWSIKTYSAVLLIPYSTFYQLDLGPPFTAAGSGKEKEKQTPRENVETVSEQVLGVAQRQGIVVHHCLKIMDVFRVM